MALRDVSVSVGEIPDSVRTLIRFISDGQSLMSAPCACGAPSRRVHQETADGKSRKILYAVRTKEESELRLQLGAGYDDRRLFIGLTCSKHVRVRWYEMAYAFLTERLVERTHSSELSLDIDPMCDFNAA